MTQPRHAGAHPLQRILHDVHYAAQEQAIRRQDQRRMSRLTRQLEGAHAREDAARERHDLDAAQRHAAEASELADQIDELAAEAPGAHDLNETYEAALAK